MRAGSDFLMRAAFAASTRVTRMGCLRRSMFVMMVIIWGAVLPSPQMTSGNPLRRVR